MTTARTTAFTTILQEIMAIIKNSTDPKNTKRPNKNPILVSTYIFNLVIIAERSPRIYLPESISPKNIYSIFSLFFTNDILETITKNINRYVALQEAYLQKPLC